MTLLGEPLVRHQVDVEALSRTIIRDYRHQRNVHHLDAAKREDALSFMIGTVWELSYLYDPPGFGAREALKRRMRSLAGVPADEQRPLARIAAVERNVRTGDQTFTLNLRHRLPGPAADECWELAQLYPRMRRRLVALKQLKQVPDYGLDLQAKVRDLGLECKALDMSFSTYAYRIGLRRVTDWFRGWGGDARYGQDVRPESLEQLQDRSERDGKEPGKDSDVEERRFDELIRSGMTSVSPEQLRRPEHRQTLVYIAAALALGQRIGELHELHPYWNNKEINRRLAALRGEFERLGVRPSVLPEREPEVDYAELMVA